MHALLLVDHGSRRAASNEQLEAVAELVRQRQGPTCLVGVAHMEIATPSIADGVAALVGQGATSIVVVPYLLAPGRHATEDIPRLVELAIRTHAGVTATVADCLGVDEMLAALVLKRAQAAGLDS